MSCTVEICATSIQSAINAETAGANRIELCENLMLGGTTPSAGCIIAVRRLIKLPINVLVRPRSGDFLYSSYEFEQVEEDIKTIKQLGVQGIVCGVLHANGRIDVERTSRLVELAKPLTFTFHRAFDFTPNPMEAIDDVIRTGATHILTSGQKNKAHQATELIAKIVSYAGKRIKIIVGSGVNESTIGSLVHTGATEFHLSGSITTHSGMEYRPAGLSLNGEMPSDYTLQVSDVDKIRATIETLQRLRS